MESVENGDTARDLLARTSKVLRQLVKVQSEGRAGGPRYEHLVRKASRITKQTVALLDEMAGEIDAEAVTKARPTTRR